MAVTDDKILIMFQKYLDRSSAERQEQTRAFTDSLEAMRKEMRIFNVLTIFALLALAGLNVSLKTKEAGLTITQPPAASMGVSGITPVETLEGGKDSGPLPSIRPR